MAPSQLPEGAVLGEDVQDFIKALIVEHCSSGRSTGDTTNSQERLPPLLA